MHMPLVACYGSHQTIVGIVFPLLVRFGSIWHDKDHIQTRRHLATYGQDHVPTAPHPQDQTCRQSLRMSQQDRIPTLQIFYGSNTFPFGGLSTRIQLYSAARSAVRCSGGDMPRCFYGSIPVAKHLASDWQLEGELARYREASLEAAGGSQGLMYLSSSTDKSRVSGLGIASTCFVKPNNKAWWAPPVASPLLHDTFGGPGPVPQPLRCTVRRKTIHSEIHSEPKKNSQ